MELISLDDVKKIYEEVCGEFRRKVPLKIDDSEGTAYFDWNVIGFPTKFMNNGKSFVRNVFRHEHGHKAIFPQDPEVGVVVAYIGKYVGFEEPWLFANVVADMIVDSSNLNLFGEEYLKFLEKSFSKVKNSQENSILNVMAGFIKKVATQRGMKTNLPSNEIGTEIYNILNSQIPLYRKIFEIAKLLYNNTNLNKLYYHIILHIDPENKNLSPSDVASILIKKGLKPSDIIPEDMEDISGKRWSMDGDILIADEPLVVEYNRMKILIKYLELKNKYGFNERKETVPRDWELGDEIEALDVVSTLSSFGIVVPGIYSLKNTEEITGFEEGGESLDDTLIILDCSGSMNGEKFERAREASYVIARKVYQSGNRIGLIPFGSHVDESLVIKPTRDVNSILNLLAKLLPTGGTNLYYALSYAEKLPGKYTTYVITDAYTPKVEQCIGILKKEKNKYTVFIINDEIDDENSWILHTGAKIIHVTPDGLVRKVWSKNI